MADRDQDYDISNTTPSTSITATQFVAHQYTTCPTTLMPLSFDWTALNDKIDALVAGRQHQRHDRAGLGVPDPDGIQPRSMRRCPRADLDKVIILLTDGDNTQNRWTTIAADYRRADAEGLRSRQGRQYQALYGPRDRR